MVTKVKLSDINITENIQEISNTLQELKQLVIELQGKNCTLKESNARLVQRIKLLEKTQFGNLSEFMSTVKTELWAGVQVKAFGEKCANCNPLRTVKVKLPSGRGTRDDCLCGVDTRYLYVPVKYNLYAVEQITGKTYVIYQSGEESLQEYVMIQDTQINYDEWKNPGNIEPTDVIGETEKKWFTNLEMCKEYCNFHNKNNTRYLYNIYGERITQEGNNI